MTFSESLLEVSEGDLLSGNIHGSSCLEDLVYLDGVVYLGVLQLFEIAD